MNRVAAHFSPTENSPGEALKVGDIVKIDLGCHLDGFCGVVAHTVYVQEDMSAEVPASKETNVIAAAAAASEALTHCFRPGEKNGDITAMIDKIAQDFDVTPVEGVLSHEMKRYIIDAMDCVTNKVVPEQHVVPVVCRSLSHRNLLQYSRLTYINLTDLRPFGDFFFCTVLVWPVLRFWMSQKWPKSGLNRWAGHTMYTTFSNGFF